MMVSYSMGVKRPSASVGDDGDRSLDPGDDGDAQLVSRLPGPAVQDVLLQEAEERLHGCVVTGGTDATHGSDHVMEFNARCSFRERN